MRRGSGRRRIGSQNDLLRPRYGEEHDIWSYGADDGRHAESAGVRSDRSDDSRKELAGRPGRDS